MEALTAPPLQSSSTGPKQTFIHAPTRRNVSDRQKEVNWDRCTCYFCYGETCIDSTVSTGYLHRASCCYGESTE